MVDDSGTPASVARCLGMFAKYWRPGFVKTRLAATIGDQRASRIYRSFVTTLLRRFAETADRRVLCVAPPEDLPRFGDHAAGWEGEVQAAGDLGQRMQTWFTHSLKAGCERVILIGADSPTIPATQIERAFRLLGDVPVVLGPSDDGGYYLVGISGSVPPIFADVDWGTPSVYQQTVDLLRQSRTPYAELTAGYDVDELPDLRRLAAELAGPLHSDTMYDEMRLAMQTELAGEGSE